ncbi:MAG TPA: chromate efflux transporter [Methylomirabilota bacterium]|nr:chromate efflux transporter [Methylomirabilota bacterium]
MTTESGDFAQHGKDIARAFMKLGATSYGGPAIMGLMQAELVERRRWVSRERFVEGLSLVNMLPGATAAQLGIFLAYARGGWWGGLLGGLCFVLPAFVVMLALTMAYAVVGVTPAVRGALYGLGPVVLGIFIVAVFRLARSAVNTLLQALVALAAVAALLASPLGVAAILVLAGAAGIFLFHSRRVGAVLAACIATTLAVVPAGWWSTLSAATASPQPPTLGHLAAYFFKVGALTVGGGLTMIAFMQQQVVEELHWLSAREFVEGLALGQLTPGPILMLAAFVGYKVAGVGGAAVAAAAAFLPSFVLMLALLPVLDRVRALRWTKAALKGMGPAVIGLLAVSLLRLAPHAVPDAFAAATLVATVAALTLWRVGAMKLVACGALLGVLRSRLVTGAGAIR